MSCSVHTGAPGGPHGVGVQRLQERGERGEDVLLGDCGQGAEPLLGQRLASDGAVPDEHKPTGLRTTRLQCHP
jgi:hypothetical protein